MRDVGRLRTKSFFDRATRRYTSRHCLSQFLIGAYACCVGRVCAYGVLKRGSETGSLTVQSRVSKY